MRVCQPVRKVKYEYCRYCGARLRRDWIGQFCPSENCQWHHGLSTEADTPTKPIMKGEKR